jgi:hypothetical protein
LLFILAGFEEGKLCFAGEKKDLQLYVFYTPIDKGALEYISLVVVNKSSRNWTVLTHPNLFYIAIPDEMDGVVPKGTSVGVTFDVSQMPDGVEDVPPDLPRDKLIALGTMHFGKNKLPLYSKPSLNTAYPVDLAPGEATIVWGNELDVAHDQKVEEINCFYEVSPLWSHFYPSVWSGKITAKPELRGDYEYQYLLKETK